MIYIKRARQDIDKKYVGFNISGAKIKPVHIAGGSQRCIYGSYNKSQCIKQLALVRGKKYTPEGNDTETVYNDLLVRNKIDKEISVSSFESMRMLMQNMLDADNGVFIDKKLNQSATSYSAGSKYFLASKPRYEDAGEFIGGIIHSYCPDLANYISEILKNANDPISLLFKPVWDWDPEMVSNQSLHEDIPAFKNPNKYMQWYLNGIMESGSDLLDNFKHHTNSLTQLRLFNLFCIFHLIRYLMMLSAFYCGESVHPILLDFSEESPSKSSIANASAMSYAQISRSITRFYSWGYADWLVENGYDKESLLNSKTPVYDVTKNEKPSKYEVEYNDMWNRAKDKARDKQEQDALQVFGDTLYDMLALEAEFNPVKYLRSLGISAGILYPPNKSKQRFVVSQDVLEMLIRSCVGYKETISGSEIRVRLWDRFGVIVGRSDFESDEFHLDRMIQIDEDSLEENFSDFTSKLESMDFAEVMADGILQIHLGGTNQ